MTLEALIFAGLGSLSEVADMDRAAWNAAFRAHDLDWAWSWDTYVELMRAGGNRQLAARYAAHKGEIVNAEALDRTHQKQFAAMLSGGVPLRPGVARVMNWAARGGVKLALVTRSETDPVNALLKVTARDRGGATFDVAVLRGDVEKWAPDPEALMAAVTDLAVGRRRALVIADTAVSVEAARAVGLPVVAFPGRLAQADLESLGGGDTYQVLSPEVLTRTWRGSASTAAE